MKKVISLLICFALIISSVCFVSYAANTSIKSSVDVKPSGIYNDSDSLQITGWAFDETGSSVVRCYYRIDGGTAVMADPVVRNDVKNAFPTQCNQADCGFHQFIPVKNLSFGSHTFLFYAEGGGVTKTLWETTFTVAGIKSDCNDIPSGTYDVDETDSLTVWGWAFNYSGEYTDCYYQIDNSSEVLLPHRNRSDVQEVFGSEQLDCGFGYQIPISEFSVGTHTVKLIAKSGSLQKIIASSEVTITSSSTHFQSSADFYLKDNYTLGYSEPVHLGGWAFSTDGAETRCYYQIDGGALILLAPDNRADVARAFPDTCSQTDCGYKTDISIADIGKGLHTYRVIAKTSRVSEVIKESEFCIIGTDGQLKSHSDHIASGTYNLGENAYARIQGWGYNTSAEPAKFYCSFDGGTEFYLTAEERADVYNSSSECYRTECGYHMQTYLGNLTAGTHTVKVRMISGNQSKTVAEGTFSIIRPEYTVSFNANGGTGAPAAMTKTFGKNLVLPTDWPTREYYRFKGWNTASDGSGEAIEGSCKFNSDAVLYAMWEHEKLELKDSSELSFDARDNLIYGEKLSEITASELKDNFENTSTSVSGTSVVTGTEISLLDNNGVYETAQAVILGDINCDGFTDGTDAILAACIEAGMLTESQLGKAVLSAADCFRDGQVDGRVVELLADAGLFLDTVDQNAAASRGYYDTDFTVPDGIISDDVTVFTINGKHRSASIESSSDSVSAEFNEAFADFNYFGLKYSSDTYAKGTVTYKLNGENYSEEFFLEPAENGEFYSFIDGVFENVRSSELVSISIVPLNAASFSFEIKGVSVFDRQVPDTVTYFENESIKIGLNMQWGGALSYYEDLDSNVQAVADDGIIRIDTNAAQRYGTESLNDSVNLINCHDTGRLVQQSYYGTTNYEMGFYNGHYCAYNPVQGGNMYNDSSKIVDLRTDENSIYIKCRPLDWAKEKEYITESYMEATYTLCGETLKTSCRFVDFSGYDPASRGQEIPAFYGAATMNHFVYYGGASPWTDGELSSLDGLDEYLYAHYPSASTTEHWGALTGEFDDSFSIGLYIPDSDHMLAGVYSSIAAQTENPDISNPTSYLAGEKVMLFRSFAPIEYDYYISTGTVADVRNSFKTIAAAQ